MIKDLNIGVVVPCYQVGETVADVVCRIQEWVDRIVLVDDGATDETARIVDELSRQDRRITAIHQGRNGGVGSAVKAGYGVLLEEGCDVLVKLDGDGQMDPAHMALLVRPVAGGWTDYAKGNRLSARTDFRQMPVVRLAGSIALTFLTKLASGYWHTLDPQNGYTAISARALHGLNFAHIDDGYFFENSMLIGLNIAGARCMDVRMVANYAQESSSMRISRVLLSFPPKLLRGFCRRIVRRHLVLDFSPIFPLLVLGLAMLSGGTAWGAYHWWLSYHSGVVASTGTVMVAVLADLFGLQLLLQALVIDIENGRELTIGEAAYLQKR